MFTPTPAFRRLCVLPLSLWAASAWPLGLGELRSRSALGEILLATIDLRAAPNEIPESACFRLRPGEDDSLPWLRQGDLLLKRGEVPVLEIRSHRPLRDPALRIGVVVGCGHDLRREYTLLPSPGDPDAAPALPLLRPSGFDQPPAAGDVGGPPPQRRAPSQAAATPERLAPVKTRRPARVPPQRDRLILSGGADSEPGLRLATELATRVDDTPAQAAQRELLRIEFRTLSALHEQALSQLAAAEKMRKLEASLGDLGERAGALAGRIEERAALPPPAALSPTTPAALSAAASPAEPVAAALPAPSVPTPSPGAKPSVTRERGGGLSEWSFYGFLLGGLLGIVVWLMWRQRQRREMTAAEPFTIPEPLMDPRREGERDEPGGVDLPVEPAAMGMPLAVDLPLDDSGGEATAKPVAAPPRSLDSAFSVSAASVHEHFEVNPVMELAEIMLSFGRVKGAAQALQEYIDQSPDEALQPWIRLLEVYRMAHMREEFERVAASLNQHYNVQVMNWEGEARPHAIDFDLEGGPAPEAPLAGPRSLEELPHIMDALTQIWNEPECDEYLQRLLRDNRGGTRSGFPLAVVQDILLLIELRETVARMAREGAGDKEAP